MKILVLGDTHGRSDWKEIINLEPDADKIVFIGDYFDSFTIKPEVQINNFLDIVEYKKQNKDKVILLFGNHDFHYIYPEKYSGYNAQNAFLYKEVLNNAIVDRLLQMCYINENFIFTHAGVSKLWLRDNFSAEKLLKVPIDELINDAFYKGKLDIFAFTGDNPYGDCIYAGCIWIRPKSLHKAAIKDFIQVVGHTQVKEIKIVKGTDNNAIILVDAIHTKEYVVLEDYELTTKKYGTSN